MMEGKDEGQVRSYLFICSFYLFSFCLRTEKIRKVLT